MRESYSALMTVYRKVRPSNLFESMKSVLNQTVEPAEFVLVCDGPLTNGLNETIARYEESSLVPIKVVHLKENKGTAIATQVGLDHCSNDLIMKMDADDICISTRAELQLKEFENNPDLSLCGSYMAEFIGDEDNVVQIRKVPTEYEEIYQFSKRRNPFNNITVMYRKSSVEGVGGYGTLRRAQDYELYARMLHAGCIAMNIPEVLSAARLDEDNLARRATLSNLQGFIKVRWMIHRTGHSSLIDFLIPCCAQLAYMLIPARARNVVYKKLLRSS